MKLVSKMRLVLRRTSGVEIAPENNERGDVLVFTADARPLRARCEPRVTEEVYGQTAHHKVRECFDWKPVMNGSFVRAEPFLEISPCRRKDAAPGLCRARTTQPRPRLGEAT